MVNESPFEKTLIHVDMSDRTYRPGRDTRLENALATMEARPWRRAEWRFGLIGRLSRSEVVRRVDSKYARERRILSAEWLPGGNDAVFAVGFATEFGGLLCAWFGLQRSGASGHTFFGLYIGRLNEREYCLDNKPFALAD